MFFRKRKVRNQIADKITDCQKRGARNLHIMVYYEKEILFQVLPIRNFKQIEADSYNASDYSGVHFFHHTKNRAQNQLDKFLNTFSELDYQYFIESKNVHCFVKNIGSDPTEVQNYIRDCIINIYKISDSDKIWLEYNDY